MCSRNKEASVTEREQMREGLRKKEVRKVARDQTGQGSADHDKNLVFYS